jgi:hypothetical protein
MEAEVMKKLQTCTRTAREAAKKNLSTAQALLSSVLKNGSRSYEGITNLHKDSARSCEKNFDAGAGVKSILM